MQASFPPPQVAISPQALKTLPKFSGRPAPLGTPDATTLSDPKPKSGARHLRNWIGLAIGATGFYLLPGLSWIPGGGHLNEIAQERVAQMEQTGEASGVIGNVLDEAAEFTVSAHDSKFETYLAIQRWHMFFLSLSSTMALGKKSITGKELFESLHRQGITGEGLTFGVIDTGILPSSRLSPDRVKFYIAKSALKTRDRLPGILSRALEPAARFSDRMGHGTSVTHIVAEALPKANFIVATEDFGGPLTEELEAAEKKLAESLLRNPEGVDLADVYRLLSPMAQRYAQSIRGMTDDGVCAINMSLGFDDAVIDQIIPDLISTLKKKAQEKYPAGTSHPNLEAAIKKLKSFEEANEDMSLSAEMTALYPKLEAAFDYALAHNVAIFIASGNDGGHKNKKKNGLGNVNFLAATNHPAVIKVGSTNESGRVSSFSSEGNDQIHAFIAANGDGQISTHFAKDRTLLGKIWNPAATLKNQIAMQAPQGTSFASPDAMATYGAMASAQRAAGRPLTINEARDILIAVAREAHFPPGELTKIEKEVAERLGKDEVARGVAAELKRRVGHGTLAGRRLAAVAEAERRTRT